MMSPTSSPAKPIVLPVTQPPPSAPWWLQPSLTGIQIVVGFGQVLLLLSLNYLLFRRSSQQKIAERRAGWFHKIVVDPVIPDLQEFFHSTSANLNGAAAECLRLISLPDLAGYDMAAGGAIHKFNEQLLGTRRSVTDRARAFDPKLGNDVNACFTSLQENVTLWFDAVRQGDMSKSLPSVFVADMHGRILALLRDYEFVNYGIREGWFSRLMHWRSV